MAANSSRCSCSSWLLMLVISVVASSMLQLQPVGARTTDPAAKSLDATDGSPAIHAPSRTPFGQFLHALFASATSKEETSEDHEMPNEIPLIPQPQQQPQRHTAEDEGVHFEDTTLVFPRMVYKRAGRTLCGRYLADALQMICGAGGHLPLFHSTGKRSDTEVQNGAQQENSWPFISSQKAHQVLSNRDVFYRQTRGVYDECCLKPCTLTEIRSYCRPTN